MMKQNKGFTLIELMLSIAIFSVISLAGFSIFDTVTKSEQGARENINRLNQLQTVFTLLERDITQIARRHIRAEAGIESGGFLYLQEDGFSGGTAGLGFVRHGWGNPGLMLPRSELQAVGYRVVDNNLERIYSNFVDPVSGEEPKVRILLEGVNDLTFEYFYGNKWQKELKKGKLPMGIAVEIDTEEYGLLRRQFLIAGDNSSNKVLGS